MANEQAQTTPDSAPADGPEARPEMRIGAALKALPGRAASALRAVKGRLSRMTGWQWCLVLVVGGYILYMSIKTLLMHHGLSSSAYDYGLYDQGVWLLSRFKAPFVTLMGRNLFGDHTSFILIFLVPFFWIAPSAGVLYTAQAAAIGVGAIPVFLYARQRLGNEGGALLLAVVFLLHPAVAQTNLENFHPDAFLATFVGFAIYAALNSRWRMYTVFVVLSLLVKEDVSLIIVPLGIWVALRRNVRIGLLTVLGSISYMLIAMYVVMAGLTGVANRNEWRIPFGGIGGFFSELIRNPSNVFEHLRSDDRPWYIWQMTAPFAWVFARLPDVAVMSVLVLGTNILSTFWYQYHIEYHYGLVAVPALALGTVHALGAMRRHFRAWAMLGLLLASLWAAFLWGPWPFSHDPRGYWLPSHPAAVDARDIISDIPADASVSAHPRIVPQISRREEIYHFPTPFYTVLYGPDDSLEGTRLPQADEVDYVVLDVNMDDANQARWEAVSAEFELVRANDHWELYRRVDIDDSS